MLRFFLMWHDLNFNFWILHATVASDDVVQDILPNGSSCSHVWWASLEAYDLNHCEAHLRLIKHRRWIFWYHSQKANRGIEMKMLLYFLQRSVLRRCTCLIAWELQIDGSRQLEIELKDVLSSPKRLTQLLTGSRVLANIIHI